MLMQVKQNRLGFNRVLLQGGRERVCTIQGRAGDLINMDEDINMAKELTTLLKWLKIQEAGDTG